MAIVESDRIATQILERPNRPGGRLTNFWRTDQTPAEYDGPTETCTGPFILHPPENGTLFRCVEFLPEDPEVMAKLSSEDGAAAFAEIGGRGQCRAGRAPPLDAPHVFRWLRHCLTAALSDCGIVMYGEI